MRQLSRIVLNGSTGSPDEQVATPQEKGGYGELVDEVDRLLEDDHPVEVARRIAEPEAAQLR